MLSSQSILHITVPHTGLYEHATSSSNFEASDIRVRVGYENRRILYGI